jgi:glutamine---fructose-6-phosphate transaminase (isomerizing)
MNPVAAGVHTKTEILSQPQVWNSTLQRLSRLDGSSFPDTARYEQVIFSGCGSTHYLARWAAHMAEAVNGTLCRAAPASDLLLFPEAWWHPGKSTLLVTISRSGETTETVRAMERLVNQGLGDSVVITCYPDQPLARLTRNVLSVPDAQEDSVAQTRSFTNMLLAVLWLVLKEVPAGLPTAIADAGQRLIDRYVPLAEQIGRDDSIQRFFFLGSGPLYGLANEAMLKMKEMSLSYAESYQFHEFRHGPMSVVNDESLVLGLISDSAVRQQHVLLQEMKRMGSRALALQDHAEPAIPASLDYQVMVNSHIPEIWRAPLYLPMLQMLAFERSLHKGLNPDLPANLTSVVFLDENGL